MLPDKPITQPNIKKKTRPAITNMQTVSTGETEEKELKLVLPNQLCTDEFDSLLAELINEKKPNKLKRLFNELNTFGVYSENVKKK
ncbi:MAG: hypothetical protein H0T62_14280 [Parachlamydiaceae bacterium]|nr:hypothetical protein [Parachlamydiaceae bacterium]